MMNRLIVLLPLSAVVACDEVTPLDDTGYGITCTEIGCSDSFTGQFQPELDAQGEYVFTLDLDGALTTCSVSLPLVDEQSCGGVLQISRSGSALPASEHSIPGFTIFDTGFASYTLTIELDGVELISWTESPEWEIIQPNGEGCEPICEVASSTVVLP